MIGTRALCASSDSVFKDRPLSNTVGRARASSSGFSLRGRSRQRCAPEGSTTVVRRGLRVKQRSLFFLGAGRGLCAALLSDARAVRRSPSSLTVLPFEDCPASEVANGSTPLRSARAFLRGASNLSTEAGGAGALAPRRSWPMRPRDARSQHAHAQPELLGQGCRQHPGGPSWWRGSSGR